MIRITGGAYKGRTLKTTQAPGYRPATSKVRLAVFSMLEARGMVWNGARVLDCFAGSGSLGFEALSRGADLAWFIENNKKAASLIQENARTFNIDDSKCVVSAKEVATVLSQPPHVPFDMVFIDPPYEKGLLRPALTAMLDNNWLSKDGLVLAEVEPKARLAFLEKESRLELVVDRMYGQTRILIWNQA